MERPLPAPTNLTLTPAGTSASLRWDPVPDATGYLVTRTSALYGTIQQTPTPISSPSFTDVSQQFDPRYLHTYRVSVVYPDGRTGASTVMSLPAPASVSPPHWDGNRYTTGSGWTTKWAAVPEATTYVVRYQMQMTNGLNAYWWVDTSIVVAAPTTSHYVGEWNGLRGLGNAPTAFAALPCPRSSRTAHALRRRPRRDRRRCYRWRTRRRGGQNDVGMQLGGAERLGVEPFGRPPSKGHVQTFELGQLAKRPEPGANLF